MSSGSFRFERFTLDPQNRQLRLDGAAVELNARYLDALTLLVREQGKLVSKERFLEEVWRGVPVTDEALTQCIKTLRRQLGDDASSPRFIETVPKHGYRFVAPVEWVEGGVALVGVGSDRRRFAVIGAAGAMGGAAAGAIGGLLYGFVGAAQSEPGAASMLLVLVALSTLIGSLGGAGVGFGIATADMMSGRLGPWSIIGGAAGGLLVGAFVKLLGLDVFNLLFGQSPGDITGGGEGALLGAAVGAGVWFASARAFERGVAVAGAAGAVAGVTIALLGGRLMAGSLHLLASRFPDSRLQIDQIGGLFGERGFGAISLVATGGFEGLLFGCCVVAAMLLTLRRWQQPAR